MNTVYLVVEGLDDENFILQLISSFATEIEVKFIKVKTNGRSLSETQIKTIETLSDGLSNLTLFILDADAPDYSETKKSLLKTFSEFKSPLPADNIFLLPNDGASGCLEDLLCELIPTKFKTYYTECIKTYGECVNKQKSELRVDKKGELYIYTASLTRRESESKGSNRIYTNEFWDLSSSALKPLLNFLKKHLEPNG